MREGLMQGSSLLFGVRQLPVIPIIIQISRVLMVVAVEAQEFPVAAVRRIVLMVVVFVMDREFTKLLALEFTPAPRTDPGKNLERLLPITLLPLLFAAPSLRDNSVHFVLV
jgi:hypothetical protein